MNPIFKILVTVFVFSAAMNLQAVCIVRNSDGQPTSVKGDPLFSILENVDGCPMNVQGLKTAIKKTGLSSQPYMVANRGIHNSAVGSFSFFEQASGRSALLKHLVAPGEFFFGHFTVAEKNVVVADQEPSKGKLLIELIAWDHQKNLFNFYELIGTGQGAQWFYRGDSADILEDNASLYLSAQGPQFGSNLRCSACHTSGGPIMKEMTAPHNDWWTDSRPLSFGPNSISPEIATWVQSLGDASDFSQSVQAGIARLEESSLYQYAKQGFSLQANLRPLFCETEINLESDLVPLIEAATNVQIPTGSIVNPLLASGSLSIPTSGYQQLLHSFSMQFPETNQSDADHAWLTPVKGAFDLIAIRNLIKTGVVTEEFVADVLAVDFEKPMFSSTRCGLLKLIPDGGLGGFPERLNSSSLPGAAELLVNMVNPNRNKEFHIQKAQSHLKRTQSALDTLNGQKQLFTNLIEQRQAVFDAEISKNPRGQILEPGFRVIFPVPQ